MKFLIYAMVSRCSLGMSSHSKGDIRQLLNQSETYHTVKFTSFVALWLTTVVLCFSSAELAKVFRCLWYDILVQFHLNPPQLLPWQLMSVTPSVMQRYDADNGENTARAKPKGRCRVEGAG